MRVDRPIKSGFSGPLLRKGGVAGGFPASREAPGGIFPVRCRKATCNSTRNPRLVPAKGPKSAFSWPHPPASPHSFPRGANLLADAAKGLALFHIRTLAESRAETAETQLSATPMQCGITALTCWFCLNYPEHAPARAGARRCGLAICTLRSRGVCSGQFARAEQGNRVRIPGGDRHCMRGPASVG